MYGYLGYVGKEEEEGEGEAEEEELCVCRGLSIFRDSVFLCMFSSVLCCCSFLLLLLAMSPHQNPPPWSPPPLRPTNSTLCGFRLLFRLCVSGMSFSPAFSFLERAYAMSALARKPKTKRIETN